MTEPEPAENDLWTPRLPVTSVFLSILLLWGAFWSAANSGDAGQDFFLFGIPAILIIPRVRRLVVRVLKDAGLDLEEADGAQAILVLISLGVYGLLGAAAVMLLIGSTVNDPTMEPVVGFVSLGFMYVTAVVIVYGLRIRRRLQPHPG